MSEEEGQSPLSLHPDLERLLGVDPGITGEALAEAFEAKLKTVEKRASTGPRAARQPNIIRLKKLQALRGEVEQYGLRWRAFELYERGCKAQRDGHVARAVAACRKGLELIQRAPDEELTLLFAELQIELGPAFRHLELDPGLEDRTRPPFNEPEAPVQAAPPPAAAPPPEEPPPASVAPSPPPPESPSESPPPAPVEEEEPVGNWGEIEMPPAAEPPPVAEPVAEPAAPPPESTPEPPPEPAPAPKPAPPEPEPEPEPEPKPEAPQPEPEPPKAEPVAPEPPAGPPPPQAVPVDEPPPTRPAPPLEPPPGTTPMPPAAASISEPRKVTPPPPPPVAYDTAAAVPPPPSPQAAPFATDRCTFGMGRRRLHVIVGSRISFGRCDQADIPLAAIFPGNPKATVITYRSLSRQHFEVDWDRERKELTIRDGWHRHPQAEQRRSSQGFRFDGARSEVVHWDGRPGKVISLTPAEPAAHIPHWRLFLLDSFSQAKTAPSNLRGHFENLQDVGVFFRRCDLVREDVLLLWGPVNFRVLGYISQDVWLFPEGKGLRVGPTDRLAPLAPGMSIYPGVDLIAADKIAALDLKAAQEVYS